MERVALIGTGLIGASIGLALKQSGFKGIIVGWDNDPAELRTALERGAIDAELGSADSLLEQDAADVYVLAVPVLAILDWLERLGPVLRDGQMVTDVGSTKREVCARAAKHFGPLGSGRPQFLPGHPMAGKESGGAALADARLFEGAMWLFTPTTCGADLLEEAELEHSWRLCVQKMGARTRDLDPRQHDEICAWVSHLPQMVSTAMSALLEDTFAADPEGRAAVEAIGGRALREMTRLGASPYSMWRDIALTNTDSLANTLHALEQRLAHLRENLRTPELREEFALANRFRAAKSREQT